MKNISTNVQSIGRARPRAKPIGGRSRNLGFANRQCSLALRDGNRKYGRHYAKSLFPMWG
jgi:hypothetical protein